MQLKPKQKHSPTPKRKYEPKQYSYSLETVAKMAYLQHHDHTYQLTTKVFGITTDEAYAILTDSWPDTRELLQFFNDYVTMDRELLSKLVGRSREYIKKCVLNYKDIKEPYFNQTLVAMGSKIKDVTIDQILEATK